MAGINTKIVEPSFYGAIPRTVTNRCLRTTSAQSDDAPMCHFMAAKNQNIPTFSRKINCLRVISLAVKESFELQQTFAIINDLWNSSLLSAYGR